MTFNIREPSEKKNKIEPISIFHADPNEWEFDNEGAFAIRDSYPVSRGHTLVVPKRAVSILRMLPPSVYEYCFELIEQVQMELEEEYSATGFNIGVNEGKDAGQTISQLHFHVIPRYSGDVIDPVGGIRNVIPGKGNYRKTTRSDKEEGEKKKP